MKTMNAAEVERSAVAEDMPPVDAPVLTRTLWLAKAGRWEEAHDLCQEIPGSAGSWIHAHLHREEGDQGNAAYWYSRAGKQVPPAKMTIEDEWREIAEALLPEAT